MSEIDTGIDFFGQRVRIDSSGIPEVDNALASLFNDSYNRTAPLEINRPDTELVLAWMKKGATQ